MSTAGGDDTAAQGNPSAAAHQPRAADNQNPTTATSNLVSPPPQQTPVPLRPLSPLRLTSPPPASQPAENNEQPSRNNEQSLAETLENDWDYVVLKKHHGTSKVYGSGFEELKIIREEEGDGDTLLEAASEFFLEAMVKTSEDESSPAGAAADASNEDTLEDEPSAANPPSTRHEKLKRRRLDNRKNKVSSSQEQSKEDRAKKAFNEYMEAAKSFDATEELKKQYSRMEKNASEIDWTRVKDEDLLYISSKFDVLEWWKSVGARKYPDILVAALPILGLPASNAFQERIFSACTWHDDPLNQRLQADRFEKKVLLGVNKDLRRGKGKSS